MMQWSGKCVLNRSEGWSNRVGHDDTYWCPVSRQVDGTFDRCSVLNLAGGPYVLVLLQFEVGFVAAHALKQAVRFMLLFCSSAIGPIDRHPFAHRPRTA